MDKLLSDTINTVSIGNTIASDGLKKLQSITDKVNQSTINILTAFDTAVTEPINQLTQQGTAVSKDINQLLEGVNSLYPKVESFASHIDSMSGTIRSFNVVAKGSIDTLQLQTQGLLRMIEELENNPLYKNFNQVIKSNIVDRIEFSKNPVDIKENKLYPIENYGSAMTPFYSVLASWVGALILVAVLSPSVKGNYSSLEGYFGRLLLFMTIAIVQALVIALGDFFILGITAKHPILFLLILLFCSLVFTTIIYSLVSVFGTVGKGIAIFLLVIKIGESRGTFPVEMTPSFFRSINALIPFTYAINACREAIDGIYSPNMVRDILALLLFMIIPIILCIFFKEPINKMGHQLKQKFQSSYFIAESD